MADFEVDPVEGGQSRLTLGARTTPWHIRIGGHDLLIEVDCERGSAGLLERVDAEVPADAAPAYDDGPIIVAPERVYREDL